MHLSVTSRHFKAHESLVKYAEQEAQRLKKYYDGIIKCEVVLVFEKPRNSDKIAEVFLSVYGTKLTAVGRSEDFFKSIDLAIDKILVQLKKYKEKLHAKDRKTVRRVRAKVV